LDGRISLNAIGNEGNLLQSNERKQNENHTDPDYHNYIAVPQRLR